MQEFQCWAGRERRNWKKCQKSSCIHLLSIWASAAWSLKQLSLWELHWVKCRPSLLPFDLYHWVILKAGRKAPSWHVNIRPLASSNVASQHETIHESHLYWDQAWNPASDIAPALTAYWALSTCGKQSHTAQRLQRPFTKFCLFLFCSRFCCHWKPPCYGHYGSQIYSVASWSHGTASFQRVCRLLLLAWSRTAYDKVS